MYMMHYAIFFSESTAGQSTVRSRGGSIDGTEEGEYGEDEFEESDDNF